jgi:hypothetical protein
MVAALQPSPTSRESNLSHSGGLATDHPGKADFPFIISQFSFFISDKDDFARSPADEEQIYTGSFAQCMIEMTNENVK